MRDLFERAFGKAAVVGFLLMVTPRPEPPKFDRCPHTGRETLLSLLERARFPHLVAAYQDKVFGPRT